jgi:hypothetical protein
VNQLSVFEVSILFFLLDPLLLLDSLPFLLLVQLLSLRQLSLFARGRIRLLLAFLGRYGLAGVFREIRSISVDI